MNVKEVESLKDLLTELFEICDSRDDIELIYRRINKMLPIPLEGHLEGLARIGRYAKDEDNPI